MPSPPSARAVPDKNPGERLRRMAIATANVYRRHTAGNLPREGSGNSHANHPDKDTMVAEGEAVKHLLFGSGAAGIGKGIDGFSIVVVDKAFDGPVGGQLKKVGQPLQIH